MNLLLAYSYKLSWKKLKNQEDSTLYMSGNLKSFDAVEADHQNQKDSTISKDAVEQEQAIEGTKPYDFYKNNK